MFKNYEEFKDNIISTVGLERIEHIGIGLKLDILMGTDYEFQDETDEDFQSADEVFNSGYIVDWYNDGGKIIVTEWQKLEFIIEDFINGIDNIKNIVEKDRNNKLKKFVYYVAIKNHEDNSGMDNFKTSALSMQRSSDIGGTEGYTSYYFKA
ncbi:MAG: hypothetical protein H7Y18_06400 [Clostridiaceae bacterium]|nr:hypothetical protein [Clostridiaceae bacterium]